MLTPKVSTSVFLYILGLFPAIAAILILLKGLGILSFIPGYVIWAIVLITVGIGIIGGLRSSS